MQRKRSRQDRDHWHIATSQIPQAMDKEQRRARSPDEVGTTVTTRGTNAMNRLLLEAMQRLVQVQDEAARHAARSRSPALEAFFVFLRRSPRRMSLSVPYCLFHAVSFIKRHTGEAHALVAKRVNVLIVVEQPPRRGADRLEDGIGRRQAANTPAIPFVGNYPEIAAGVNGFRVVQEHLILVPAMLRAAARSPAAYRRTSGLYGPSRR